MFDFLLTRTLVLYKIIVDNRTYVCLEGKGMYAITRVDIKRNNKKLQCFKFLRARLTIVFGLITLFLLFTCLDPFSTPNSPEFTYKEVIVQPGDTLWELAARSNQHYGDQVQIIVRETMKYNNLTNTYIQPGQILYIPVRL